MDRGDVGGIELADHPRLSEEALLGLGWIGAIDAVEHDQGGVTLQLRAVGPADDVHPSTPQLASILDLG